MHLSQKILFFKPMFLFRFKNNNTNSGIHSRSMNTESNSWEWYCIIEHDWIWQQLNIWWDKLQIFFPLCEMWPRNKQKIYNSPRLHRSSVSVSSSVLFYRSPDWRRRKLSRQLPVAIGRRRPAGSSCITPDQHLLTRNNEKIISSFNHLQTEIWIELSNIMLLVYSSWPCRLCTRRSQLLKIITEKKGNETNFNRLLHRLNKLVGKQRKKSNTVNCRGKSYYHWLQRKYPIYSWLQRKTIVDSRDKNYSWVQRKNTFECRGKN